MKKAQFEIQFNWIFVLAAGAVILLFFSVAMFKQKSVSEQTTNLAVLRNLEAIITGAEVSTGTVNFLDTPKIEIDFECNQHRIGSASKRFEIISVFAPYSIKSNKMITWTLDWNLPYRVTNFLYLTSPNIRYILVGDDDLARDMNKTMPKELNKELVKVSELWEIENENDDKVRFVFFNINVDNSVIQEFKKMKDEDVTALKVGTNGEIGTIEFFEKEGNIFSAKGTSYYLKKPSLIGAVFTDDVEMYNCVMNNAFKKLNIVTEIYKKKTEDLQSSYGTSSCATYHTLENIDDISRYAINIITSREFNLPKLESINLASKALEQQNKQAQLHSCALIY